MESYGQPVILLLHLLAAYAPRKALAFKTQDKHARLYANASTNANATMAHTGRQLRDEIHMNSSVSSSLQYPHFHRGVMNSLKSAASSVASVAAPSLKKAEKLLKCVDKCNGRGTCEIDFSRVTKDGVNNPFYCKCQEGYIGISCATKVDQYLKWFMTKGKTEFPRCCNICNEQEQAPAHYEYMPRQMNPFNPEHCNVLYQSNVARNSAPSWSLSSSKKKADDGSCCVICSPNYIQAQRRIDVQLQADVNGLRPPQAKGPTWFWEWGEPGLGGGGQPNLIPTKDGSENTCCSVCPRRVEGPFYTRSDNDMTSEERRNILDTGAETAQKRGFYEGNGIFYKDSGCCETCPSQFWLQTKSEIIDDPFADKSAFTYKTFQLGNHELSDILEEKVGISATEAGRKFENMQDTFLSGADKIKAGIEDMWIKTKSKLTSIGDKKGSNKKK